MLTKIRYITLLLMILSACDKNTVNINLTALDRQRLVMEGSLTDSLEKQVFTCSWTQALGNTSINSAAGINLYIETPSGVEYFQEISPGTYQSENAFKGEYGETYRIEFEKNGVTHSREIKMPQPIEIKHTYYQSLDSINQTQLPIILNFHISSPMDQFLRFKIETANPSSILAPDTNWTAYNLPIYRIAKIPAGDSVFVSLPIELNDNIQVVYNSLIRIQLEVIPTDIGEYLLNLKNYSTNKSQEGKLLNPPYFYSNEAYGLGYGTITYEIIHQY